MSVRTVYQCDFCKNDFSEKDAGVLIEIHSKILNDYYSKSSINRHACAKCSEEMKIRPVLLSKPEAKDLTIEDLVRDIVQAEMSGQ